ncbi:uncharacterized protein LOC6560334 [Drosophila grimshawi]|uniref:GH20982 n=1 Tax=Drosophila grimshawi TaxID=7222 RepID=B4J4T3_DROGR|nr:uncharacterized protein LOC6560334 [Drosophila grimshawi]EDW00629.1 GH20982 [Drosophila grimshawi]
MDSKSLLVVLVVLVCSMHSVWSQTTATTSITEISTETTEISTETTEIPFTSCSEYNAVTVDLNTVKGVWYETGRANDVNMQCKEITVPEKDSAEKNLDIDISYVDSSDDKWESTSKTVTFPWNTDTQNGIFTWKREKDTLTYKLIKLQNPNYAFFCGYDDASTYEPFIIWSRNAILSTEQKDALQKEMDDLRPDTKLVWVEQSEEKCSSAMRTAGGSLVALALALVIYRRNI